MSGWFETITRLLGLGGPPTPPKKPDVQPLEPAVAQSPIPPPPPEAVPPAPRESTGSVPDKDPPRKPPQRKPRATRSSARNTGYLIVVGLDFGTAYTKCVVRDAMIKDPGRAFAVPFELADGPSYLFPSVVFRRPDGFATAKNVPDRSENEAIDFLKMRLVAETSGTRATEWSKSARSDAMLPIVAWYLGQVLAEVGRFCRGKWRDFGQHPEDTFFVNCCVPIAYSDGSGVDEALRRALSAARASVGAAGTEPPSFARISEILGDDAAMAQAQDYCYTYPETSANLQCYLKSRARQPGLYLFMDVGAGTVDLSFFQLMSDEGDEAPLRYYHASVLDAGSSLLEHKTLEINPTLSRRDVRSFKEGTMAREVHGLVAAFKQACLQIHNQVGKGVGDGVVVTERKLHPERDVQLRQMRQVQLMFAGGGFCEDPYERAARFFQKARQWGTQAPMQALPTPADLEWQANLAPVSFSRLSVAYGLAFARYELDGQRFPSQTALNPDAPVRLRVERPAAPTKDEV